MDGDLAVPRGAIVALHLQPVPGFFWTATLGPEGFILRTTAGESAAIPLEELTRLCCHAEPRLNPQPAPVAAVVKPQSGTVAAIVKSQPH